MRKRINCCLLLSMTLMTLVGCGNEIPEMDETTRKMVVEYATDVVRGHNANNSSRLMDIETLQNALEEEARLKAVFSKDYSPEIVEENAASESMEVEETEVIDKASEQIEIQAVSLVDALALEDTDVVYAGYEVTKAYPESTENIYFTMDATAGNELVVLKFNVTNTSQSDKIYDMLSQGLYFKIVVDGENRNALTTMLLNDLSNYQGTIAAGVTEQLVLVCEIPEEKANNISNVTLQMKTEDGIITIALD